jgi:hypothetical protein
VRLRDAAAFGQIVRPVLGIQEPFTGVGGCYETRRFRFRENVAIPNNPLLTSTMVLGSGVATSWPRISPLGLAVVWMLR